LYVSDPTLQFQFLNQQRLAMQEKALLAGKDLIGYPPHMMTRERQQELLKGLPPAQLLEMQKRQQLLHLQQQQQMQQQQMQQEKLESRRAKDGEQEQKVNSEWVLLL
jgi:multidrug efflux pump subunit AcrA (membrane-fusion protein)